jgi:hypothetical protein
MQILWQFLTVDCTFIHLFNCTGKTYNFKHTVGSMLYLSSFYHPVKLKFISRHSSLGKKYFYHIYFPGICEMENICNENIDSTIDPEGHDALGGSGRDSTSSDDFVLSSSGDSYSLDNCAESDYEYDELVRPAHIPDKDSAALSILSCFLRNNLLASASKDILQTFKNILPDVRELQEISFQTIWSKIDCMGVKEFHYCTTCDNLVPFSDEKDSKCNNQCPGLRYKGMIEDQLKKGRQLRGELLNSRHRETAGTPVANSR